MKGLAPIALIWLLVVTAAHGQDTTGTIEGGVTDPTAVAVGGRGLSPVTSDRFHPGG